MDFIKNIRISFLSLVLFILLPVISIIIFFMALDNLHTSYNIILKGFDKKLSAISSVTASFIEGSDHEVIAKPTTMEAFTYDASSNILYGISKKSELYKINREKGAGVAILGWEDTGLSDYKINDISIDSEKSIIYAVTRTHELLSIDLKSKKVTTLKKFAFNLTGLAYEKGTFYISSNTSLYTFQESNAPTLLKKYTMNLYALNFWDKKLYGVDRSTNSIFTINVNSLNIEHEINKEKFSEKENSLHHLAVDTRYFYGGLNTLMTYERNSSLISEENFAKLYRDESSKLYLEYIHSMTEIKLALNLTYHYTFKLLYSGAYNCVYIMDVNEGSEYTPIGSYDSMDDDDFFGAENVISRGSIYAGAVKLWDQWGLLKVAYAGITDKDDTVVAIVGTDVDISIIQIKTRDTLIQSIILGILALILSILASYYIAIKIIRPITSLKYIALKIASGNYGNNVSINSPLELSHLSSNFNQMSHTLKSTVDNFKKYTVSTEDKETEMEICYRLNEVMDIQEDEFQIKGLIESQNVMGIFKEGEYYYIYALDKKYDALLDVAKERMLLNDILKRCIRGKRESKFIKLFKPIALIQLDMNALTMKNILNNRNVSIQNKQNLSLFDIKILINPEGKSL